MANAIAKVERYSVEVADQPGEGVRILEALKAGKVNLIACWGYPLGAAGNARIELVPEDGAALRAAVKKAKIKVKKECGAFCVADRNKVGALAAAMAKLAEKGINVRAVQAVATGTKYGALIEVDPKDVRKAARALGV
ncbi:MAG: hypothetical protein J7M38_05375 [Armatimonadetes bacterium]|nr:hypothetical protein [Armatimonadota bacterium]